MVEGYNGGSPRISSMRHQTHRRPSHGWVIQIVTDHCIHYKIIAFPNLFWRAVHLLHSRSLTPIIPPPHPFSPSPPPPFPLKTLQALFETPSCESRVQPTVCVGLAHADVISMRLHHMHPIHTQAKKRPHAYINPMNHVQGSGFAWPSSRHRHRWGKYLCKCHLTTQCLWKTSLHPCRCSC